MTHKTISIVSPILALLLAGCSAAAPTEDAFGETSSALVIAHTVRLKIILLEGTQESAAGKAELDGFTAAKADQIVNGASYSAGGVAKRDENGLRDIYNSVGIDFDFDYARDVERIVNDALRDDCVRPAPGGIPTTCWESGYGIPASWNQVHPQREALAKQQRGQMVLYLRSRVDCADNDQTCKNANPYWVPRNAFDAQGNPTRITVAVGQGDPAASFQTSTVNYPVPGMAHYSHEAGHWLGALAHTHEDNLADTPADPGPGVFYMAACQASGIAKATCQSRLDNNDPDVMSRICSTATATVNGVSYTPDKGNVMSYYSCPDQIPTDHLSQGQADAINTRLAGPRLELTRQYENLGDTLQRPTGLAVGVNNLHVFWVGSDRRGRDKALGSSKWWPSDRADYSADLGGDLASPISAVSWGTGRIDMVARSSSGHLMMKNYGNSTWFPGQTTWHDMGTGFVGNPKIISWGPNRLDIFARNSSNHIVHKTYDGSTWYPSETTWTDLGGTAASDPVAISWASGRIDVFFTDTSGTLKSKSWSGGSWSPSLTGWYDLGNGVSGEPAVVSWGAGRLDVFARNSADGHLKGKNFSGSWYPSQFDWFDMGGSIVGSPSAVTWGTNRLDIFARSTSGAVMGKTYSSGTWAPSLTGFYTTVAGSFTAAPSAVSWGPGRIDLFTQVTGTNGVAHRAHKDTFWWPIGG